MLTETLVSTILTVSITGAGLILAIYALITPISRKMFEERLKLLRKKKEEFDKKKRKIDSESSDKDFKLLRTLASEIQAIKAFPQYLGSGVLIVFVGYFLTIIVSFLWFIVEPHIKGTYEPSILILFFISTIGFLSVGVYAILDVYRTMKEEYEQVKKEKKEVVLFSKKVSWGEIKQARKDVERLVRELTKNKRKRKTEGKTNEEESEQES